MSSPSPTLAAFLSFIFPGAGQLYAGEPRRAIVWALPMLVFILAVLWVIIGGSSVVTNLLTAPKILALIVLNIAFFLYHVAATLDAYNIARRDRFGYSRSGAAPIALASLVALAILMHGLPTAYAYPVYQFLAAQGGRPNVIPSFSPLPTRSPTPVPSGTTPTPTGQPTPSGSVDPSPTGSGDPGPTASPRACAPLEQSASTMDDDGRVNLLLVGSDSRSDDGVSAASIRTDSMLLLSIDIASCKAAMFSFPRNMQTPREGTDSRYPDWLRIPLEAGGEYPGFLFGLWRDAASSPGVYPGSEGIGAECQAQFDCERGWQALSFAIQSMTNTRLDAVVSVNLKGFVDVVNNLPGGGIWIDVPSRLQDTEYFNSQQVKMNIDIQPGCQFMDGELALAYARSRHQDSDYQRARRQQHVLQQVRKQLDPLGLLPHIPALIGVAQANLFMTVSDTDFPFLAQVASRIDADRMYRYDFAPARLTRLESMQGIADKVNNIFSEPEPTPTTRPNQEPCPPRP